MEYISSFTFENCTILTNINIPPTVKSIWTSAFEGCTGLTSLTIPSSVIKLGHLLFRDCTNLQSVTFENPNDWYTDPHDGIESFIKKVDFSNPSSNANRLKNDSWTKYFRKTDT